MAGWQEYGGLYGVGASPAPQDAAPPYQMNGIPMGVMDQQSGDFMYPGALNARGPFANSIDAPMSQPSATGQAVQPPTPQGAPGAFGGMGGIPTFNPGVKPPTPEAWNPPPRETLMSMYQRYMKDNQQDPSLDPNAMKRLTGLSILSQDPRKTGLGAMAGGMLEAQSYARDIAKGEVGLSEKDQEQLREDYTKGLQQRRQDVESMYAQQYKQAHDVYESKYRSALMSRYMPLRSNGGIYSPITGETQSPTTGALGAQRALEQQKAIESLRNENPEFANMSDREIIARMQGRVPPAQSQDPMALLLKLQQQQAQLSQLQVPPGEDQQYTPPDPFVKQ